VFDKFKWFERTNPIESMDQERRFNSHRKVLVCRGVRDETSQFFFKDNKLHLSKALSARKDTYAAFVCNFISSDNVKCGYKMRVLGDGLGVMLSIMTVCRKLITIKFLLQVDAEYIEEGQHNHAPDKEKMKRSLLRSRATDLIDYGMTNFTPQELFADTCQAHGYVYQDSD
jgi:hypothetical protein